MARQMGLTEEKIQELWDYQGSDAFTPREEVALRFAELMVQDPERVDDAFYQGMKQHLTEPEILELGFLVGICNGGGRFVKTMNLVTWEEACALDPVLAREAGRKVTG